MVIENNLIIEAAKAVLEQYISVHKTVKKF